MPTGVYRHKPHQGFPKGNQINLGRHWKLTEETKRKMSEATLNRYAKGEKFGFREGNQFGKGKKNWQWKGGITPLTKKIRKCFKYCHWRLDIFKRDNFICQLCGIRGMYLEVDHHPKRFSEILEQYRIKLLEQALACEELWDKNNGRTLCQKCHNKTKGGRKNETQKT